MPIISNNEEFDSTLLVIGAIVVWILQNAALIFVPEYASTDAAEKASRFTDSIVLMIMTYKFTKSGTVKSNGGTTKRG